MSNFLRGGQVTTHKFRMTLQVIRTIVRCALLALLFTILITFKNNITSHEWKTVPVLLKQYVYQDLDPNKIITYKDQYGRALEYKVGYLKYNREIQYIERKFYYVFMLMLKRLVWVSAFSLISSILFFWYRGRYLNSNKQMRGSELIKEDELKKLVTKHNVQFAGVTPYKLAGIPYPATGRGSNYTPGEQAHTLILGATGSGKTKVIQELVKQLEESKSKAIIVDIKGDYISHFFNEERGDIILNPLDKRGKNWSFFKETDSLKGFDTIATTLMPDAGRDPFWINAARLIFSEFASIFSNENLTLAEFAYKLLNTDIETLERILSNTKAKHLINQKADKTVICILMMLATYLAPFKLYNKREKIFSISDWIKDSRQNNFLFISTSPDVKGSLNSLVQMQVDIAINALCSLKEDNDKQRQIWFILDELAYFDQGITNLKDGLTMSRSFGGAFVLGAQDMSSLSKIYGHDLSRVIANNCRNKFIMNVDDSYTAKWCSELFGEGEVEEWNEGLSYGAHEMRDGVSSNKYSKIKSTILASEFAQLKTGSGYLRMPGFNPALVYFKSFSLFRKAISFIEDTELKILLEKEMRIGQQKTIELQKEIIQTKSLSIEVGIDTEFEDVKLLNLNKTNNNKLRKSMKIIKEPSTHRQKADPKDEYNYI